MEEGFLQLVFIPWPVMGHVQIVEFTKLIIHRQALLPQAGPSLSITVLLMKLPDYIDTVTSSFSDSLSTSSSIDGSGPRANFFHVPPTDPTLEWSTKTRGYFTYTLVQSPLSPIMGSSRQKEEMSLTEMAMRTRSSEIRREVHMLSDQLKSSMERTKKSIEDFRTMVANLTAAMNKNQHTGMGQGCSGEIGEESQNHEEQGLGNQGYQMPTKCSTMEFPKFHGEDLRGWVYRCEQFFDVDETPDESKIYLIEVLEEGQDEGDKDESLEEIQEVEEGEKADAIVTSHVSMHALTGVYDFSTMRVTGNTKGKAIHILIDTGSTHIFLDLETAKRLRCKLEATTPFPVAVADGGCDAVLGIQWLVTLGEISWDFNLLKMEFQFNKKKVALRGMQPSSVRLISNRKMKKTLQKPVQLSMMHVGVISTMRETGRMVFNMEQSGEAVVDDTELTQLLQDFADIFEEPHTLPPNMTHDHSITLKERINPISVRPIRRGQRHRAPRNGGHLGQHFSHPIRDEDSEWEQTPSFHARIRGGRRHLCPKSRAFRSPLSRNGKGHTRSRPPRQPYRRIIDWGRRSGMEREREKLGGTESVATGAGYIRISSIPPPSWPEAPRPQENS
ncbi:hypothetical protein BUALT_Bualt18G0007800 [Buddleja alternifolia]|uniref:Uncharacterized protein n=1 Tax=Buddleja alternifolia TaxID=168488 RepID=A0AAV6W1G4_9LAMI|nr:hypothetical protein BUALT_Bualt18G0007800 [Buddleja alternifolia]